MRRLLLAVVTGLVAAQGLPQLPTPRIHYGIALLALAGLWPARWRFLACFALAAAWSLHIGRLQLAQQLPRALEGEAFKLTGVVDDIPARSPVVTRFLLVTTERPGPARWPAPGTALALTAYAPVKGLRAGAHCVLYARLQRPHGVRSPGAFDFEQWAHAAGLDATGYLVAHPANHCAPPADFSLAALREQIADAIARAVPAADAASILAALAVGARSDISPAQWDLLRDSGIIHLLSVSGLHVAMVAMGLAWLLRRLLGASTRAPVSVAVADGLALCGAAAYALLAGFTVPTQRTLIMLGILMMDAHHARARPPFDALLLAAACVLVFDPLASLTLGFWLSFLAIGLLIWRDSLGLAAGRWARWGGVHLQLALWLAPLSAFAFAAVPVVSPLANALAVPVVSLGVVPLVLFGMLVMVALPALAVACWSGAAVVWTLTWRVVEALAAAVPALGLPVALSAAGAALVTVALLCAFQPVRSLRRLGFMLVGLVLLLPAPDRPDPGDFVLTALDVGQGLAVVVETRHHVLLYDTGARFRGGGDFADRVVLPWLARRGYRRLDGLMVSHADLDHAGGLPTLRAAMPTGFGLAGQPREAGASFTLCRAGQAWTWDGVRFAVVHPADTAVSASDNDRSCVLIVTAGTASALLTGDITSRVEADLLTRRAVPSVTTLVLAHHGSGSSSSAAFLDVTRPRHAVVSAGYRNRFGHPAAAVLHRLRAGGSVVHETARLGTLSLKHTRTASTLQATRHARRYWDPVE